MLLQIAEFCSILWQSGIPFYICTTSSLSIYLLMDIYAAFLILAIVHNGAMNFGLQCSPQGWGAKYGA